MVQIGDIGLI